MSLALAAARTAFASAEEEVRRAAVAQLTPAEEEVDGALAFLVEAMGDPSWRVRKEAVTRAASWPDRPRAAAALTLALAEPDNVGRRNAAIEGLVALASEAVPPLVDALARGGDHRKVMVDTIGLIGDPAGAAALEPFLGDSDPNVRVAAAEALGLIGGAQAQAALRRTLAAGSGELLLTLAAVDGLNRSGARLPLSEIEPLLVQPTLRAAALEALARGGDPAALPHMTAALHDPARSVREAATRAIAELYVRVDETAQRGIQQQMAILARPGPQGGAPAKHGDPVAVGVDAVQALIHALLEGTLEVQGAAAMVLGLTRRLEAVRPLTLALGDPELRDVAMQGLVAIGPQGIEALVTLAPDLEGRLRADVYSLLPRFGPTASEPRVQALLGEALGDEDVDAAAGAAQALGEVGGREALAPLLRALEREGPVALAAATALGRLGVRHYDEVRILISSRGLHGPEAPMLCRVLGACGREADAPLLKQALGAESAAVRRAAAEALALLPLPVNSSVEVDEALLFAMADEVAEVRAAAARALGAHAANVGPQAIDALERAAHDLEMAVRAAAARALGALAREASAPEKTKERARALAVLRKLAEAPEAVAAVPALEALGEIGEPADDARLIAALDEPDAEIVKAAARGLGFRRSAMSAARAREALDRALTDRRWDVRRAAALALGDHGPAAHPLLYARRTIERDPLVLEALEQAMSAAMGRAHGRQSG